MIYYQMSTGERFNLSIGSFTADEGNLRSYVWDYNYSGFPNGSGGTVTRFYRHEKTLWFNLSVHDPLNKASVELLSRALHDQFEYDIRMRSPGKLWLDKQYIICYVIMSDVTAKSKHTIFNTRKLTVLPVVPFWCMDVSKTFYKSDGEEEIIDGKKYNGRYPYKYGTGYSSASFYNTVPWPTPMIITISGPVANPSVTIGDYVYTLNTSLTGTEYAVIDQVQKKVYKVNSGGIKTNIFSTRDKTRDIFKYAPGGDVSVLSNGEFTFTVTLVQQRSEPLWST